MKSLATLALVAALGCGASTQADALYASQLQACVAKAATVQESHQCRGNVDRAWGLSDAGSDQ